ncbi:hypothetical protein [Cohnella sp. AR92]|uniref:hypothetical protein n=1 Tax=Cohnella sp. AR92 TaxID=648716 RepID=UPI000F8DA967|nr:hypothetical protein [Cohnella sp. AR92]RUS45833.1 hypothetical protein ELR57_18450 [Cohnella sp. AR92]
MFLKTVIGATLLAVSVSSSTSHAPSSKEDFQPGVFQSGDLFLYDSKERVKVGFGMSKEEVAEALGEPIDDLYAIHAFEYSGIKVHYDKENKVNGLIIDSGTENPIRFSTPRGIEYGDPLESILEQYGEPISLEQHSSITTLTYIIERTDEGFLLRKSYGEIADRAKAYTISMNIDGELGLSFIMIADYEFTMNPRGL